MTKDKLKWFRTHAIITGKIATVYNGKRMVRFYFSGEKLLGKIEN